ncbi:MAG: WG repeat-containing protein [Chitinophagaceae bacterium]
MKYKIPAILSLLFPILMLAQVPAGLKKQFQVSRQLTKEYFVFEKAGKHGVVSSGGAIVLPAAYNDVYNTRFGLFVVNTDSGYGVVNAKNKIILPFAFTRIDILSAQRIHVQKNHFPMILSASNRFLKDTTEQPPLLYQMEGGLFTPPMILREETVAELSASSFLKTDSAIFILTGDDTLKTAYEDLEALTRDGRFAKFKQGNLWGMVDESGKERIPASYDDLYEDYNTGLIIVTRGEQKGLLDAELQTLPAGPFEELSYFNQDGIAIVTRQGQDLLIDRNGKPLVAPANATIQAYGDFLFNVQDRATGSWDIIDATGKSILPAGTAPRGYSGNIILLTTPDKKMGAFHAAGIVLLEPVYDEVFYGNTDDEDTDRFLVRMGSKWGVMDITGKQLVPYEYDRIKLFSQGLATAVLNKKEGVISGQNKVIVPFIYDETSFQFNDHGLLRVMKDGKYGFVNKSGTVVIPVVYESVDEDFEQGLSLAKKDGKWGYLDTKGKVAIPFEYDEGFVYFYGDKTKVRKGATWYEVDKTGKVLGEIPPPR